MHDLCVGCGGPLGSGPSTVHSLPGGPVTTHIDCSLDERCCTVTISESTLTNESDAVQHTLDAGWPLLGCELPLLGRRGMKAVCMIPPLPAHTSA